MKSKADCAPGLRRGGAATEYSLFVLMSERLRGPCGLVGGRAERFAGCRPGGVPTKKWHSANGSHGRGVDGRNTKWSDKSKCPLAFGAGRVGGRVGAACQVFHRGRRHDRTRPYGPVDARAASGANGSLTPVPAPTRRNAASCPARSRAAPAGRRAARRCRGRRSGLVENQPVSPNLPVFLPEAFWAAATDWRTIRSSARSGTGRARLCYVPLERAGPAGSVSCGALLSANVRRASNRPAKPLSDRQHGGRTRHGAGAAERSRAVPRRRRIGGRAGGPRRTGLPELSAGRRSGGQLLAGRFSGGRKGAVPLRLSDGPAPRQVDGRGHRRERRSARFDSRGARTRPADRREGRGRCLPRRRAGAGSRGGGGAGPSRYGALGAVPANRPHSRRKQPRGALPRAPRALAGGRDGPALPSCRMGPGGGRDARTAGAAGAGPNRRRHSRSGASNLLGAGWKPGGDRRPQAHSGFARTGRRVVRRSGNGVAGRRSARAWKTRLPFSAF